MYFGLNKVFVGKGAAACWKRGPSCWKRGPPCWKRALLVQKGVLLVEKVALFVQVALLWGFLVRGHRSKGGPSCLIEMGPCLIKNRACLMEFGP